MGRLIAQTGFAGSVGGTVTVYGTTGAQTVTVLDVPGDVTFDASFNRGGNVIVFTKAASEYQIVRSGSSVVISDNDSRITIPIGAVANTLQFTDGDRALRFDGGIKVGDQLVDATAKTIAAAGSEKSALPQDTSASASRLVLSNETVSVGGKINVFGSVGSETVNVVGVANTITFDASFNRGGDRVNLNNLPETYTAKMSGSTAVLSDGSTTVNVPIGAKGLRVGFSNEERTLVYSNGNSYLGNQPISASSSVLRTFTNNLKFSEISNAFVGDIPYQGNVWCNRPAILDINQDGFLDIVFLWSERVYLDSRIGEVASGVPSNSSIQIFINNGGNGFSDQTAKYLTSTYVNGAAEKFEITDLNGDDRLDIVYATSREDGRSTANYVDATSPLTVLISAQDGIKYDIFQVGGLAWYSDVFAFTIDEVAYFAGSGDVLDISYQQVFYFDDGEFRENPNVLPQNGGYYDRNAFAWAPDSLIIDVDGDGSAETIINTIRVDSTNSAGYVYCIDVQNKIAGEWVHTGSAFPQDFTSYIKNVKFISWSKDVGEQPVFYLSEGKYAVRPEVFSATSVIKLSPDSEPIFVSLNYGSILYVSDINKVSEVEEGDLEIETRLYFAKFINGVEEIDLKVTGLELGTNIQAPTLEVLDFNKDGYDDIVIHIYNYEQFPTVLINNKDNSFSKFDGPSFPDGRLHVSRIADFNNDGIPDVISYIPGTPSGASDINYFVGSPGFGFG